MILYLTISFLFGVGCGFIVAGLLSANDRCDEQIFINTVQENQKLREDNAILKSKVVLTSEDLLKKLR